MSELFAKQTSVSWIAGEERKTPKGTSIGGRRSNSYWTTRLTDGEIDSEVWQLEDYLEKMYQQIAPKIESLETFFESSGRLELFVSLFGTRNFGFVLNPDLLLRLGEANIELQLDIYPE